MLSKNIPDYVKVYKNVLDDDLCDQTVNHLKNLNWHKHRYFNSTQAQYVQSDKELSISYDRCANIEVIENKIKETVYRYISYRFASWFDACNAVSGIRWNKYDTGTKMELHCDHIHDLFDGEVKGVPILSIVGSLNDNYSGGEFVMWENTPIEIPKGAILIFPSNFLYPHQVNEVKSGIRYTYVSWAC